MRPKDESGTGGTERKYSEIKNDTSAPEQSGTAGRGQKRGGGKGRRDGSGGGKGRGGGGFGGRCTAQDNKKDVSTKKV